MFLSDTVRMFQSRENNMNTFSYNNEYEEGRLKIWDFIGQHFGNKNETFFKDYTLFINDNQVFNKTFRNSEQSLSLNIGGERKIQDIYSNMVDNNFGSSKWYSPAKTDYLLLERTN